MKQKIKLILIILLTIYTFLAYFVSLTSISNGKWVTTPGGSLFPIPIPTMGVLPAYNELNIVDFLIYNIFIRTGILLGITIAVWVIYIRNRSKKNLNG